MNFIRHEDNRRNINKRLRCSVCLRWNVMTKDCSCRRSVLQAIPCKQHCEPLRLSDSPSKLKFDVIIGTDVIPVVVDTLNNHSTVNQSMIRLMALLGKSPKNDNTIDIIFKVNELKYMVNCTINKDSPLIFTMGLSGLLDIGMELKLGETTVRGMQNSHLTNPRRDFIPRDNVRNRHRNEVRNRHQNRNQFHRQQDRNHFQRFRHNNRASYNQDIAPPYTRDIAPPPYPVVEPEENWDLQSNHSINRRIVVGQAETNQVEIVAPVEIPK